MKEKSKKLCVVIDTNIWKQNSTILLKTPLGAALLYCIKQNNGCIGLPEVIENEVIKHTIKDGYKAVQNINENFKIIEIIGTPGRRGEVSLRGTCVIGGGNKEVKYEFREDVESNFKQ